VPKQFPEKLVFASSAGFREECYGSDIGKDCHRDTELTKVHPL